MIQYNMISIHPVNSYLQFTMLSPISKAFHSLKTLRGTIHAYSLCKLVLAIKIFNYAFPMSLIFLDKILLGKSVIQLVPKKILYLFIFYETIWITRCVLGRKVQPKWTNGYWDFATSYLQRHYSLKVDDIDLHPYRIRIR